MTLTSQLAAQQIGYRFNHIALARDIGQINTQGVVKDAAGFMWIGANESLLRFDGSSTRAFKFAPEDINLDRTAWTSAVEIDPDGNIWLGTRMGLARLAPKKKRIRYEDSFNRLFKKKTARAVTSIAADDEKNLWCVINGCVYRYNYETKALNEEISLQETRGRPIRIFYQPDATIWVIYRNGFVASKKKGEESFRFDDLRDYPGIVGNNLLTSAGLIAPDGRVYMATKSGIFHLDLETKTAREIRSIDSHLELKGRARIRALCLDKEDPSKIWVGTKNQGLAHLDLQTGRSTVFRNDRNNPSKLMSDNIYSIQQGRSGSIWIGCSAGYSIMNSQSGFSLKTYEDMGRSPPRRGRPALVFDQNGQSWLGLPDSTIRVQTPEQGQRTLRGPKKSSKLNSTRQCLEPGANGEIWFSVFNKGLIHVDSQDRWTFLGESSKQRGLRSNKIENLLWLGNDQLVIGTTIGMEIYSPSTGTSRPIEFDVKGRTTPSSNREAVRHLARSESGVVYATTLDDWLLRLEPGSEKAIVYPLGTKSSPGKPTNITEIRHDGANGLWVSAFNGLFHWNDDTREMSRISTLDHFPHVGRNGFLIDQKGKIWLAGMTNSFVCYSPENDQFCYLGLENRIGRIDFIEGQHAKDPDGGLHFLCRQGIVSFDPSRIQLTSKPRKPVITGLDVLGEELWEGRQPVGLSAVEIDESDNFVTLRFVSPDNRPNDLLTYSYRLSNFRSDWVEIGSRKAIDFSNLPAGQFKFEVKATYDSTGSFAVSSPVTLVVKPPLLARPRVQAAMAVGVMMLGGLFAFIRFRAVNKHAKKLQIEIDGRSRAEAALAESEASLATAFESMPCATWVRSRDGTVTMANPLFVETWGNMVGKKEPAETMPDVYADHWVVDHQKALSGMNVQENVDYSTDNDVCRVIHVVSPIKVDGEVAGTVGIDIDISALRRSEVEKIDLERQLRHTQKLEAIGKLAGGVAHDFNNILTAISGHAELIKKGLKDGDASEQLTANLDGVLNSSCRAARLTHQLLTFTKMGLVIPEVFDPGPVLEDMKSMMSRLIRKNIDLSMDCEENIGRIRADRAQFEQIILNLIVNSSDAMPDGGKLAVSLSSCHLPAKNQTGSRKALGIEVVDTGSGMSADIRSRVFEPYFSTKPVSEGTGLGLSTVHGIVEGLEGTISISSQIAQGTTIRVVLPCLGAKEALRANVQVLALNKDKDRRDRRDRKETVVVCDDNDAVRAVTCGLLKHHGFEVIEASSPAEAIRAFASAEAPPPLLITDVVMPVMDGPQLAQKLLIDYPELKVIFMSGYAADALEAKELRRKNVGFLNKPFSANTLMQQARLLLDSSDVETKFLGQEAP
ncbi:MAG: PAS domain S-box-containing protein [Planctomycetota bacterium]|jgi:PAS domain S-box-containing protein